MKGAVSCIRLVNKTIFALLLFLIIALFLSLEIRVGAQSAVSFSLEAENIELNRLFTVKLCISGECADFSACKVTLTYDSDVIELRKVTPSDDGSEIKYEANSGKTELVFLNTDGIDTSKGAVLAGIDFKAENAGKTDVNVSVEQCIDSGASNVAVSKVTGLEIEVAENSVADKAQSSSSQTQKEKSQKDGTLSNSASVDDENTEGENRQQSRISGEKVLSDDSSYLLFFAGAGFMAVLCITCGIAFYLGTRHRNNKTEKSDNDKNKTADSK